VSQFRSSSVTVGFKNHVELLELGHVVSATSVRHTTHVVLCSCAAAKVRPQRAGSSFALLQPPAVGPGGIRRLVGFNKSVELFEGA
jgi:hypothetical protein